MANQQTKNKKFINGVFVRKVWQDETKVDNSLYSIGIKKEDLLHYLNETEADERGFINWSMGAQVSDSKKMSLWENDFNPTQNRSGGSNYNKSNKPTYKAPAPAVDDADDLPF